MRLSVIVTNYNYAAFLPTCLDSALALRHDDKEIIIVDDGSSDRSREIILKYAQAHPNVVVPVFKANGGQTDSLNHAFLAVTGDLIYTLDADDFVDPAMIEEVLAVWKPGANHAQFYLKVVDQDATPTGWLFRFPEILTMQMVKRSVLRTGHYPWPPTSGNVYSRAFLEKILPIEPPEHINRTFDTILNTLAPLYGETVFIAKPLASYRQHRKNGRQDINVADCRRTVTGLRIRDDILREHAERLGLTVAEKPRDHDPNYLKDRVTSFCLDATNHPVNDNRRVLLTKSIKAVIDDQIMKPQQKAVLIVWFTAMLCGPGGAARTLARMFYVQSARPEILVKALRLIGAFRQRPPAIDANTAR